MANVGWYFPVLNGGGEEGYTSNDIEAFKGEDLYVNLARETCQNSLDAKEPDAEDPIVVKYELREFDVDAYPFFTQYKECIDRCKKYWEGRPDRMPERLAHLLTRALRVYKSGKIPVLVVSDYNTPGLIGSQTDPVSNSFNALVYAPGVSYKESDTSAGSFGIGRNAPFACSDLSCVCYNTKAKDGGEAFAGVAKLATMCNEEGKRTLSQGRYQHNDDENEQWRPIRPSDNDDFANLFHRDEHGTDVIIFGFQEVEDWQKQLEIAVLNNFFLAIHQKKLVVEVQGNVIDADTIAGIFQKYAEEKSVRLTHQYYKAIIDPNSTRCDLSILEDNDAEFIIRTDSEIETLKSVAWFRGSGMLIRSYRPQGVFRPYVAVFIAKGNLDKVLRDTEPARHNDWDYKRIDNDPEARAQGRKAIQGLMRKIKDELKSTCESVVDDTIDAAGAADYLPDSLDGNPQEGGGTDVMRPLIRIGKSRKTVSTGPTEAVRGRRSKGRAAKGNVNNHSKHPSPDPKDPSVPVEGKGKKQGVAPGAGGKTIVRPVLGRRRLFAIAPDQGLYRLVVSPGKSANNVVASCLVLGENGNTDSMKIKTAMLDGHHVGVTSDGKEVGPFSVEEGKRVELMLTFEEQGSMALEVELNEKGDLA